METVVLVIHLMLAVALIAVILLQRTAQDGGGLMGGGSTMGGMFTARGSANLLTRTTAVLATGFICTSLLLAWMASHHGAERRPFESMPPAASAPAPQAAPVEAPKPADPQVPMAQ